MIKTLQPATNFATLTTIVGGNEIALPGYLQVENTLDYNVDYSVKPLAAGGGGVIRVGDFLSYGVGA